MRTIAIANLKGGVAKTTTAINMAAILAAEHGKRVLLVDADSQHDATKTLLPPDPDGGTITDLFLGVPVSFADVIVPTSIRGLDLVPSDVRMAAVGLPAINGGQYNRLALRQLRDWLIERDEYDYIIIDCPSAFVHPGCQAAILAADTVIIPASADGYSIPAAESLAEQVDFLRSINPGIRVGGCLLTRYRKEDFSDALLCWLMQKLTFPIYDHFIRYSPKVPGSTGHNEGLLGYSPRSAATIDYRAWAKEFLDLEEDENDG